MGQLCVLSATPGQTRAKVTLSRKAAESQSRIEGELADMWKNYAAMESTLNAIRKVTGCKGGDLVQTISDLADGGKMKKDYGILKANLTIEQSKVKRAEKEKVEMLKRYEEVKSRAEDKEQLYGLLNEYLRNVEQVCSIGGLT